MAKEDADGSADVEEGGPVKSFLDHLEDLRWALIKCASAIGLGVLICLLAGNYVVGILLRPLQQATIKYPGTNQVVTIRLGTNNLTTITLDPAHELLFNLETNRNAPSFSAFKTFPVKFHRIILIIVNLKILF